jgi:hypothetical protein
MNDLITALKYIAAYGKERPSQELWLEMQRKAAEAISNNSNIEPGDVWGFVERYLPGYYQDNDVARSNDLQKIIDHAEEEGDCADQLLKEEFAGDRELAKAELTIVDEDIFRRTIEGYLAQNQLCTTSDK